MFPLMGTPKCVAFRSKHTGKLLESVHEGSEDLARSGGKFFSEVSGAGANDEEQDVDVLASPYTRFYLEPSKEHEGLLHVRCCHNNKYWAAKNDGDGSGHWLIGLVNEPDGDISKSSCTLFEPVPLTDMDNNLCVRFFRPGQSESAGRAVDTAQEAYLHLGSGQDADQEKSLHEFSVHELSQLVMPRYVAFKGDNDMYLRARVIQGYNYLEYAASDIADPTVVNTISPVHLSENIYIKSNHYKMYWRLSPNWIWADSDNGSVETQFRVVQMSDHIALQNVRNRKYCMRLTADRKKDCLNAGVTTITEEAKIRVEEAVLERRIHSVSFRLSENRIYGEVPLIIPTVSSENRTSEPNKKTLAIEYLVTDTKSFRSTVSLKIGVAISFKAGIPVIAEGEAAMSTEASTTQEWGKTKEVTNKVQSTYEVIVPPMSRVTLRASATKGLVDVPFSYRQTDMLTTGQTVESFLHDGLFTGANSYNFQYETTQELL